MNHQFRILIVCTGNICRSPTAEYILRQMLAEKGITNVIVESRGTSSYHDGEHADARAIEYARTRGIDMSTHRVRGVSIQEIIDFDLVIGVDIEHVIKLRSMVPEQYHPKIKLLLRDYAPTLGVTNVPDPYYGKKEQFAYVYKLIEWGCRGLIDDILAKRI